MGWDGRSGVCWELEAIRSMNDVCDLRSARGVHPSGLLLS